MLKIISTVFLLTALVSNSADATTCPAGNQIEDPELLAWTYEPGGAGVEEHWQATLEIGEATLTVGGESITTRVYRVPGTTGTIPGPTMEFVPGRKYVLQFRNALPYEAASTEHNVFKDPNVSNLHTHGLHISGETPGDDVTRGFEGTAGGDFVYDIPADHMGGTFWYHAHHHGSTFLQVSAGAFGLMVVDDSNDQIPSTVAAMEERRLVVAYLDPDVAGTGGDTLITGTLSPTWTVNGKVNGDLCVPPDTWQHWRVLLADRDAKPKDVEIGSQCEVALMSRDGVWRTVAPKELTDNTVSLTGASRADLAVRCAADSEIRVGSTVVANIFVDGTPDPTVHPYDTDGVSTWSAIRPAYLRDLRSMTPVNTETVNLGARTINGSRFNINDPTFSIPADGLQRWTLKGARNHPFHLHIYHVQIDGNCGEFEDGEYYDVVAGNCSILFDLGQTSSSVYDGRTIMHCHILEHEDQGAMGWTDVLGGIGPPTFPSGFAYQEYFDPVTGGSPPTAPSGLVATADSSSSITLSWSDNSGDEDGFDIEHSSDGTNFTFLDFVGANITAYTDAGLTPSSTWYYRVRATNANGSSGYTNVDSATTQSSGAATTLSVDSINVSTPGVGRGDKVGRAVVVIRDDQGALVAGATVQGEFAGDIIEVGFSDVTDSAGSVTFQTSETARGGVNVTFCVTDVLHPGLTYNPGQECGSN